MPPLPPPRPRSNPPPPSASPLLSTLPQIRESIKALFPDRDCFTLVRPVNEEDALARLDTLPPGAMRPEFQKGLTALTTLIFNKV